MIRFEGWKLTGWLSVVLIVMAITIVLVHGWSEEGLRAVVRATARTSVTLFLLAFGASSFRAVWPSPITGFLLRNRRYIGVSFAASHAVHLMALITLGVQFPDPFVQQLDRITLIGGGIAYVFIVAMAATSSDRAVVTLGPRRWKLLHTVGGYYIWLIFVRTYAPQAFGDPSYIPATLALLAVMALRFNRRLRR